MTRTLQRRVLILGGGAVLSLVLAFVTATAQAAPAGPAGPARPPAVARVDTTEPGPRYAPRVPPPRGRLTGEKAALQPATPVEHLPRTSVSAPPDTLRPFLARTVAPPSFAPEPASAADPVVAAPASSSRIAIPDAPRPVGATGQCKDGTWLTGGGANACADRGGLAVMFTVRLQPAAARP